MRCARNHLATAFKLLTTLAIMGGLAGGWISCTNDGQPGRLTVGRHARHAVHGERMRVAMRRLETKTKEEVAAELYTGESVAGPRYPDVAAAADAMADTAMRMPEALEGVTLDQDERELFLSLAGQLQTHAREVSTHAKNRNQAGVREAMQRVNSTCDACHNTFRF